MAEAHLTLHRGAREVDRFALDFVPTPPPAKRWFPIGHGEVVDTVRRTLTTCGFTVSRDCYGLSRDDARLFATLDIGVELAPAVRLAVGVRNSLDQTFPLGFCAGSRVFVCDNLAFSAELMVRRKHTRRGHQRFADDIATCVSRLPAFVHAEHVRIHRLQESRITDTEAESLILRATHDQRIIGHRLTPRVLAEWREPTHDDFRPRTAWSLLNAFTLVMADRARLNPQAHAVATMALQGLLNPERN